MDDFLASHSSESAEVPGAVLGADLRRRFGSSRSRNLAGSKSRGRDAG